MTSVTVRGDQMAAEMGGLCLRSRYLTQAAIASCPALIWIVEADLSRLEQAGKSAPQILDVINPPCERDRARLTEQYRAFRYLFLNTESSRHYLGDEPAEGWKTWVVPHHHCNFRDWLLPESRLAKPKVVGYLGEPCHLHDTEEIREAVEKMGMRFISIPSRELGGYQKIDIGIAWTRRETQRDTTRSNIKLTNFAAHGIPSVVCDYESYRGVDRELGGIALIRGCLKGFLEAIDQLARDEELRRRFSRNGANAQRLYSRQAIAGRYQSAIDEIRRDWRN